MEIDKFSLNLYVLYKTHKKTKLKGMFLYVLLLTSITLSKEALKYKTRKEFKINDSGAYSTAIRMKILDEICSHMIQFRKPNGYWTKEKCKDEALKFTKRVDFENGSGGAYNFATKNKWMDEICSHMKYIGNKVIRLVYVYEFIDKHVYVGLTYNIDIRNESHKSGKKVAVCTNIC